LLSAEKDLEEDALKRIIKFLAGFIEKVYFSFCSLLFLYPSALQFKV